jgi:cytosine/adenosine deaminase-related metal-dependent hydrolase
MNGPGKAPTGARHGRLWARHGLDPILGAVDGLRVEWREGRWSRVERSPRPPADFAPEECFADHCLTPGLLNAHAHLDYSFLRDRLPAGLGFVPWLRLMIQARRSFRPDDAVLAEALGREGLQECLKDGVTTLWDIDAYGWTRTALAGSPLESISFDEWILPDPDRWRSRWDAWHRARETDGAPRSDADVRSPRLGVSVHAPYTVCPEAMRTLAGWASGRGWPLAVHLAESREERELLVEGRGALRDLLAEIGAADPSRTLGTGQAAIARAAEAGLLSPATLAIHCNLPEPADAERLARADAVVVFCPRSHRFFGYPPYPLAAYRSAGVRLALGTDSLASNWSLSLRAEAREVGARFADVAPLELLGLATGNGLGESPPFGGRGRLEPGRLAHWALWEAEEAPSRADVVSLVNVWLDPRTRCARSSAWPGPPA